MWDRRPFKALVNEHLVEVLVASATYWCLVQLAYWVISRSDRWNPALFFVVAGIYASCLLWLLWIRPRRIGIVVSGPDLLVTNYWRKHVVHLPGVVLVRHVRGRGSWPLVEVVAANGAVVLEAVDSSHLEDVVEICLDAGGHPAAEYASEDPLFSVYGYSLESCSEQIGRLRREMGDGIWLRRWFRVY